MAPRVPSIEEFLAHGSSICVIGLGYVGLPLAIALAGRFGVVGFDIQPRRIAELEAGNDRTGEVSAETLRATPIRYSSDPAVLSEARFIIVTVPTPIDSLRQPDLGPLRSASTTIGRRLQPGTTVVFESTVYPGCTEEECVPLLERESHLRCGTDFFVGYSPERINPGDREHTVDRILKVVSGDSPETARRVAEIYRTIIPAGVHVASSIQVAEAAKVIENTQRDLNIALMNELAMIFGRQGINTSEVLAAAATKWNFLPFKPGLVGGHCIGVDPYYLAYRAESLGLYPEVILAGRRTNDSMGRHVAEQTIKKLIATDRPVKGARVLILGWTFKENVADIRNTRVVDIHRELESYGAHSLPHDPLVDPVEVHHEYGVKLVDPVEAHGPFDAIILAVRHNRFTEEFPLERLVRLGGTRPPVILDVKGFFPARDYREAGLDWWQL